MTSREYILSEIKQQKKVIFIFYLNLIRTKKTLIII